MIPSPAATALAPMNEFLAKLQLAEEAAWDWASQRLVDGWNWFDALNREEWLIVLAVCCAMGFLCMKSWGRRGPC